MKLSSALTYAIFAGVELPAFADLEAGLESLVFNPCGPSQQVSAGFFPPRGEGEALVESVGGQWIAKILIESKSVPTSAIKRETKKRIDEIERNTGRKPGRKETRDIKEDVKLALLPMAFPTQSTVGIWIDPQKRTLVLDTNSMSKASTAITLLVHGIENMSVMQPQTVRTPASVMAEWLLTQELPEGFDLGRSCELKALDESRATVNYDNTPLDTDEVRQHVQKGLIPTRLALTWNDRVSFVLTEGGNLRSVKFMDGAMDVQGTQEEKADAFDADVAIFTGELRELLSDLSKAMGGPVQMEIGEQADTSEAAPATTDALYDKAVEVVRSEKKASVSHVQRVLRIGYNQAARLVERMQDEGVVSLPNALGARTVIQ